MTTELEADIASQFKTDIDQIIKEIVSVKFSLEEQSSETVRLKND